MKLFEKIKHARKGKELSQKQLAKIAGLNVNLISKYETNNVTPTIESLKKIAKALEVTTDYLLFDDTPKDGVSKLNDLNLFEKFKSLETMEAEDRRTVENVIDAVIVKRQVEGVVKSHLNK